MKTARAGLQAKYSNMPVLFVFHFNRSTPLGACADGGLITHGKVSQSKGVFLGFSHDRGNDLDTQLFGLLAVLIAFRPETPFLSAFNEGNQGVGIALVSRLD